jgi:hypothetical protein
MCRNVVSPATGAECLDTIAASDANLQVHASPLGSSSDVVLTCLSLVTSWHSKCFWNGMGGRLKAGLQILVLQIGVRIPLLPADFVRGQDAPAGAAEKKVSLEAALDATGQTPFRPSWIRSPGRMQNTFANEVFLNELAAAAESRCRTWNLTCLIPN